MSSATDPRIDRVLDPGFVAGLADLEPDDLRERLAAARGEEEELSYLRRLVHGELDILRDEVNRRTAGGADERGLVERLTAVLGSGPPRASRGGRTPVAAPAGEGHGRTERILSEARISRLPDMSPEQLAESVERLVAEERDVSDIRRRVHEVIDALEAELVGRYKAGLAPPV